MTVLRPRAIPVVLAFLTLPGLVAGQVQVTVAGRVVEFGTRTSAIRRFKSSSSLIRLASA